MAGHRNTKKMTLRLRPDVVEDLKDFSEVWDVAVADVVAAGVERLKLDPTTAEDACERMKAHRLSVSWKVPPSTKKKKRA